MSKLFEIEDGKVQIYDLPYSFSVSLEEFKREAEKILRHIGDDI